MTNLLRTHIARIERLAAGVTDVMDYDLTSRHLVKHEVRVAHDWEHADARVVCRPAAVRKHLELLD
jgi:hypothetical protein